MPALRDPSVRLVPAEPLRLHPPSIRRTDCNSPLLRRGGRTLCLVSHYLPKGHTLRAVDGGSLWPRGPFDAVRLIDDPEPTVGKWIQTVWRAADGTLFGWFQAEEPTSCAKPLFLPHIGALRSDDDGLSWRFLGTLLRAPRDDADCDNGNGFFAGGYGDFCVIGDRIGAWFYLHYSSYVADENAQGICVLRYPVTTRQRPDALEAWCDGRWAALDQGRPVMPIFGVRRGWRHRDPAAFWGPAIHYNRDLDLFVMMLNWTEGGSADFVQRGIFVSFNEDPADPTGWSPPRQIVEHGSWYPQVIGTGADEGDTLAGADARFFMSGYSAWTIHFARDGGPSSPTLAIGREAFAALFGAAPW
ncbi:MAG: hypothetical protein FJX11_04650 [Alphaproteobacteria bacterium]|nr:hypothetical protein [Alphaproteobacteria bacterium]